MRLPGTRYQEHGWEQVRKLLGQCSLQAFAHGELDELGDPRALLGDYVDAVAAALRACARSARAEADGNSYGDSVAELALGLALELQTHVGDWVAFIAAVRSEHERTPQFWNRPGGDAILRKKVNDMYAVLRDKVDADNYSAACGRQCSPNKMYTYRMLDTAYGELARIFAAWVEHRAQVAAILDRPCDGFPIEVRQMTSASRCKGIWVIRWSETLVVFTGSPGPLHTKSKRFASLKNSPQKIEAMLVEIGDYEELSANRDNDWQADAMEASGWLDDYWRVLDQSQPGGEDQILPADADDCADAAAGSADADPEPDMPEKDAFPVPAASAEQMALAESLSLPPRYIEMATAAQERSSWSARTMCERSMPVKLAVYLKMLGSLDDSYPNEWLDPATGELPTMQQLATLDGVSLPTLRKRRDESIAMLLAATRP